MSQSLEQIYISHRRGLFGLALAVTRREDQAEEALHEAFARLCRNTDWLQKADATAYVFKAVRNAAIDQLRRRKKGGIEMSMFAESGEPAPPEKLETAERDKMIRQAVERLPDIQREILVMKVYGGLTFQQIADTLEEPLSTIASRYRRTLDDLKAEMEQLV